MSLVFDINTWNIFRICLELLVNASTVRLLHCDMEFMGSSRETASLLVRVKLLCTFDPLQNPQWRELGALGFFSFS